MRWLWWIPISLLAVSAGVVFRYRRRRDAPPSLTTDPVSSDWLARARGRDEQQW
jgi:hypothetical protein